MSITKTTKILFYSGIAIVGLSILFCGFAFLSLLIQQKRTTVQAVAPSIQTIEHPTIEGLYTDINIQRTKAGITPLMEDGRLDASATAKCQDMVAKNYWAHNDPTGRTPWHFITDQNINWHTAGENLEFGYGRSSDMVVVAWMNSPEHKANILNPTFTTVGYAICPDPNLASFGAGDVVVQHFVGL